MSLNTRCPPAVAEYVRDRILENMGSGALDFYLGSKVRVSSELRLWIEEGFRAHEKAERALREREFLD